MMDDFVAGVGFLDVVAGIQLVAAGTHFGGEYCLHGKPPIVWFEIRSSLRHRDAPLLQPMPHAPLVRERRRFSAAFSRVRE
jgi:hypothetical protein